MQIRPFPSRRRARAGVAWSLISVITSSLLAACAELTPEPPRRDVTGCYRIALEGAAEARAPAPPHAVQLTERPFLERRPSDHDLAHHRFDVRAARTGYLVYADTAFHVAWWWDSEPDRRFGIGNHNRFAAFYIEAVVRGERLEGEMRRWLYGDGDEPVAGPDTWVVPLTGRRADCAATAGTPGG